MRIKEIRVEGLFEMFDHVIPLNLEERVTVIYGINGVGKTMIFKMLDYLFNPNHINLFRLSKVPFTKMSIIFEDTSKIILTNNVENLEIVSTLFLKPEFSQKINFSKISKLVDKDLEFVSDYVDELNFRRIGKNKFLNKSTGEIFETIEILDKFSDYFPSILIDRYLGSFMGKEELFPSSFQLDLFFVQTQRLILFSSPSRLDERPRFRDIKLLKTDAVTEYSQQLRELIRKKREEYDEKSNELELSLGDRIRQKKVKTHFSDEELEAIRYIVENERNKLKEVGLLNDTKNINISDNADEIEKAILAVNLQDMQTKLKIYDELYNKLNKFLEILNERRLSFKNILITEQKGIIIKNDKNKELNIEDLSSGEQHEIVLLYLLFFKIPENSLILIDEPEISLHITWQKEFLKDLEEIAKLRKFDIIVSTHSPSIINGNWDLTVSLDHAEEQQPTE